MKPGWCWVHHQGLVFRRVTCGARRVLGTEPTRGDSKSPQAILDGCTGVPVRAVGRLLLKGKTHPLQAFEPLAATDGLT